MSESHSHSHNLTGNKLRTAFALTAVILIVELVGGIASHSLALLSDAGHVLTDIFALGLAWFATVQADRPADAQKTYGYHRTGILAALANAVTLILIVGAIGYEAVQRFQHPEKVTPWLMFVAAAVGIIVNLYIGFGFRKEDGENLNVRAAMLHVFGDVGASIGVIVGGVIILLSAWYPADPLISLFIAALIAWGAWQILRETVDILMEAAPKGLNVAQMVRDMIREPEVRSLSLLIDLSCQTTITEAKISITESIPKPANATERAAKAAPSTIQHPTRFQPSVAYSSASPRRVSIALLSLWVHAATLTPLMETTLLRASLIPAGFEAGKPFVGVLIGRRSVLSLSTAASNQGGEQ